MNIKNILTTLVGALLLAACAAPLNIIPTNAPTGTPSTPAQLSSGPKATYHFVMNRLLVPTTQAQSQLFALDLDGDSHPDNLFGNALALLVSLSPGLDLQSTVDQGVHAGQVVMLQTLQTNDLVNNPDASWSIFLGQQTQSPPRFDGTDQFTLDASVPTDSLVNGPITSGHFTGSRGNAHVRIIVMGEPVQLDLIGVRIEADVSKSGCTNGRLGGGITASDFQARVLPAIAAGLNQMVASDKGCSAGCSNPAKILLQAFDTDKNGSISLDELKGNMLLNAAISPDLDLLDASGKFNPRQDGVKDSLSIGLGFTCVPAIFKAPDN